MNILQIQQGLTKKIATLIRMPQENINITAPLAEYGLDSVHAVGLSGDIEAWLGMPIEPTIVWDFPTIEAMSIYLAEQMFKKAA